MERYQEAATKLFYVGIFGQHKQTKQGNSKNKITKKEAIRRYLDITNEELYYIEHNYIPNSLAYEWIEGMFQIFVHIWKWKNDHDNNKDEYNELIEGYKRVRYTFNSLQKYDGDTNLIKVRNEALVNLKQFNKMNRTCLIKMPKWLSS